MHRIGPWVFAAGMALLVAGIASSGLDGWKPKQVGREEVFALDAADAVDIGTTRVDAVTFVAGEEVRLGYVLHRHDGPVEDAFPGRWSREGDTWVLDARFEYATARDVALQLPARISRLSGRKLAVTAKVPVRALQVEGADVQWVGDAGALTLRAVPPPETDACGNAGRRSALTFASGQVERLHIVSAQGEVKLGDLSQVGEVVLELGADVRLQLDRVADLEWIRLLPHQEQAAQAWSGDGDAGAARLTCTAMRQR